MKALKGFLAPVGWAALVWVIVFIIETILISGGRYEKNLYLGIVSVLFTLVIWLMIVFRQKADFSGLIFKTIVAVAVLAVLDFLVKNLLLDKNNLAIYKFWATYADYGAIIVGSALKFLRGGVSDVEPERAPKTV